MGKREDGQDLRQDHRRRAPRQTRRGYGAALVGCCLAAAVLAGFRQAPGSDEKSFSQQRAWADLLKQVDIGPRKPGTPEHVECRNYISDELKKSCEDVHFQPFTHKWSTTGQDVSMWNIIGDQNYKDAKIRVALFAHWDCRAAAEQDTDPANKVKPIPGANDDASGVAVLLELSRVLKGRLPKGVGVEYVFTDGKDLGPGLDEMFLGATAYAKDMANHPKPNYGIVIDMVGRKDLYVPMEMYSARYARTLLYALYKHASDIGLDGAFPREFGKELRDDHVPLINAGLRTIDLIDFNYLAYWHTLQDTPDKCSPDSLGKVGKLLQTWLMKDPPFSYDD